MEQPIDDRAEEFDSLTDVAAELQMASTDVPEVMRRSVSVAGARTLSVVKWGHEPPEVVFLHGGGQNARTWDLVAMYTGRPAIAIDLPGHGHSSWRDDHDYSPQANAETTSTAIEQLAPDAALVVGMSLGGLTTIRLAATRPDLVRTALVVDVLPGSGQAHQKMSDEQRGTTTLIAGRREFDSLDEMVQQAVRASPRRPASAVRRGVVHNSRQLGNGRWAWRYDDLQSGGQPDHRSLWEDLATSTVPMMLVKGGDSAFVTPDDLQELTQQRPDVRVEVVAGAGHSVQSDQPKALGALILELLDGAGPDRT